MTTGYYGKPVIKPPEWTDLIPAYFFTGGLAGASAALAFAARLARNDSLARTMLVGSALATAASMYCLIADLKRPERFLNMLRVFKPTSPMSVGVYIFSGFGTAVFAAAASELTGIAKPAGRAAEGVAAFLGPAMSVYTGVLIGDTVVPAWHYGRRTLPMVFAASSASSAAGFALLFGASGTNDAAARLALLGSATIPLLLRQLHREVGDPAKGAYEQGEAGGLSRAARMLNSLGFLCVSGARLKQIARKDPLKRIGGALLFAGALAERFAIYRAGVASARDPKYVINAQTR